MLAKGSKINTKAAVTIIMFRQMETMLIPRHMAIVVLSFFPFAVVVVVAAVVVAVILAGVIGVTWSKDHS